MQGIAFCVLGARDALQFVCGDLVLDSGLLARLEHHDMAWWDWPVCGFPHQAVHRDPTLAMLTLQIPVFRNAQATVRQGVAWHDTFFKLRGARIRVKAGATLNTFIPCRVSLLELRL